VRGNEKIPAPSPLSSPVEGEEVRIGSFVDRATRVFLILLIQLLVASFAHAQTKEKVRVALGSISVNTSVIPVGHQYGLYAKYGVDLEPIYMGGGMNSLAAVTSNSVQFLSAGSTATISARLGGMDITMLSVQSSKLEYSIFAAPEIKTPQDLKGKIVTGTRPGASADSALRLILRKWGLEPGKDVIFISVGESQQGRMNALQRGSVAATALTPPFSGVARQLGFRELIDMRKSDIEYAGSSIAGMVGYIKSHPQLVENFLKGYIESLHFFRSQKEKTVAGIMKFMKLNDRSKAEEGYEYYLDLMPVMPYASVAGVKAVLQFLAAGQPKAATANPEDFYDHSFLKKIEDSGFAKPFAIRR
jgi:ABC-type nitrate/sulfonate/bicarbonate transport system substrate-binding protein